jgi:hydrogenase-4 component B
VIPLLLAASWGLPLLLALLWCHRRGRSWGIALAPWAAAPALLLALVGLKGGGDGYTLELPLLFTGAHFTLDSVSTGLLLLTAVLWLAGGVYAARYHLEDERRGSFFLFFSLTMSGNLGLILAGDLLTFYLFFALMTFAAYGLVVHERSEAAGRAGRIYIVMAILGELALLSGLFSLGVAFGGVPLFGAEIEGGWRLLEAGEDPAFPALATGILLAAGFGVKAGLAPLHLWLPLAHPVAPTAASALLSGAMIKAGLLGWLRVLPEETALPVLGTLFLVFGAVTAFYGVVAGLPQDDPKTVLAYSSVSQMGYLAMGMGLLLVSEGPNPLVVATIVLYALHHGIAKGALFLGVGVADRHPRPPDDARDRWILLALALPALALAGLPLTTGAHAKNLLKEGLAGVGGQTYAVLDPLLLVAAVGTGLLMVRFLVTLHRRRLERAPDAEAEALESPSGAPRTAASRTADPRLPTSAGPDPSPPGLRPPSLVAPWIAVVGAGVLGILWLPAVGGILFELPSRPLFEGWLSGLLPVLLAAGVGALLVRHPHLLGPFRTLRIPAGDLLVPVEALLGRAPRPDQDAAVERGRAGVRRALSALDPVVDVVRTAARRDLRSIQSPLLGVLIGLLALLLLPLLLL